MTPVHTDTEFEIIEKVEIFPGHFLFPDDNRLAVTMDGKILNLTTNRYLKQHPNRLNYFKIVFTSPGVKHKAYNVHRVIARTLVGRPIQHIDKPYDELMVNHIDADPSNNAVNNLEWVTAQENIMHAKHNDLLTRIKEVMVRNNVTQGIHIEKSLGDATIKYNVHKATLSKHLNSSSASSYDYNGFSFKFNDDTPWLPVVKRNRCGMLTTVIDKVTKELHLFDSLVEAVKFINEDYRRLNHLLITRKQDKWENDKYLVQIK